MILIGYSHFYIYFYKKCETVAHSDTLGGVIESESVAQNDTLVGMTESEAYQIRMSEIELEQMKILHGDPDSMENIIKSFIPLAAIVTPFLITLLGLFFYFYYHNKKAQARYRIMEKAIDAGCDLPEGFFDEPSQKEDSKSGLRDLRQGMVLSMVGIGLTWWSGAANLGAYQTLVIGVGLVCGLVGMGKLIVCAVTKRMAAREKKSIDEDEQ